SRKTLPPLFRRRTRQSPPAPSLHFGRRPFVVLTWRPERLAANRAFEQSAGPLQVQAPTQQPKCCSRFSCLLIGKPKSTATGTGPSIGTTTRRPSPASTRYSFLSVCSTVPLSTNRTVCNGAVAFFGTRSWHVDARSSWCLQVPGVGSSLR